MCVQGYIEARGQHWVSFSAITLNLNFETGSLTSFLRAQLGDLVTSPSGFSKGRRSGQGSSSTTNSKRKNTINHLRKVRIFLPRDDRPKQKLSGTVRLQKHYTGTVGVPGQMCPWSLKDMLQLEILKQEQLCEHHLSHDSNAVVSVLTFIMCGGCAYLKGFSLETPPFQRVKIKEEIDGWAEYSVVKSLLGKHGDLSSNPQHGCISQAAL